MYVDVKNDNYGYQVTTHDDWVVVGNPSPYRYNLASSSFLTTGSIDIFRYNPTTDQHDLLWTLYKPPSELEKILLASDPDGENIHTDVWKIYKYFFFGQWKTLVLEDIPIEIDPSEYILTFEDDYGHAIDVYNNVLAVGSRWNKQEIIIPNQAAEYNISCVDIYNLTNLNTSFLDGTVSTGSGLLATTIYFPIDIGEVATGSFGHSVSINNEWLAVGTPLWENHSGGVHMYRRNVPGDINDLTFTYFSTITGSSTIVDDYFGHSIDLNKQTGSYSGSLLVGCGNNTNTGSKAYYFEFNGTDWQEKYVFEADRNVYPLAFYNIDPIYDYSDNEVDGFGNSVALFENDIAIGAPLDRWIYEYSGSMMYKQGAVYFYRNCVDRWDLVQKFYGNDKTLKNNKLGFSVDIWDGKAVIGSPKLYSEEFDPCYIKGSLWQLHYCYSDLENYIHGQWIYLQRNTSSFNWDILNVYQRKKRYLSPYRSLGYDVAIANKSIVVGAPLSISGSIRKIDIDYTGSIVGGDFTELEDVSGKAYIYNLNDFRKEFHVGNVFYRNGKIVLNTSGSIFEGMWFNPINQYNYEYQVQFDSKQTIHEKQIMCVVEPGEFNVSTNPTAIAKSPILYDINGNGIFDWQDMDVILRYMQNISTRYTGKQTTDWSSSLLCTDEEKSYYNYYSSVTQYNTDSEFLSQSFFRILDTFGVQEFDFNQDSKIDINDLNIFWKYCSNGLEQSNYQSYISPNSQRRLFSDIIDHLDYNTQRRADPQIKPEFLMYMSQSIADKTGSYLSPYVTTIGLYSGLDLVAIAKLGTPAKLTGFFTTNFVVKMDF